MDYTFEYEMAGRLLLSFLIGTAIGFEREYRGKAAGLRTMIMICLGSTIFTELSLSFENSTTDRVASTIITGIGFLGAGVIFKDGLTINGITTATTIWICAALGMAVGLGQYFIAMSGMAVVLVVLIVLEKLKSAIDSWHQVRIYHIHCHRNNEMDSTIEAEMKKLGIRLAKFRDTQDQEARHLSYELSGRKKLLDQFDFYLRNQVSVLAYEY